MKNFLTCKECADLLVDFLDGNLDAETHQKLDKHLSTCPPCLNFLNNYRSCSQLVERLRDQEVQIPLEMETRLKSFLRDELKKL